MFPRSLPVSALTLGACFVTACLLSGCGSSSADPAPDAAANPIDTAPESISRPKPDPALTRAIDDLADSDRRTRSRAAALLRERAEEAEVALRTLAAERGASEVARSLAVRILSEQDADADFFCSIYSASEGKLALETLDALSRCGAAGVACLVDALHAPTAADRAAVVRALVEVGEPAMPALLSTSDDPSLERRLGACASLARIVRPDSPHAAAVLTYALACLDERSEIAQRIAQGAIESVGASAIPALVARIRDEAYPHREFVATTLAALGSPAFDTLVELTRDSSPDIRALAFHGFSKWNDWDEAAVEAVTRGFADPEPRVRLAALVTIRQNGDTRVKPAIPALFDVLAAERPDERRIAETTLVSIGPAVGHRLPRLISGGTDSQKLHATRIAGQLRAGAESCIPALEALLEATDDERLAAEIETALRRIRKKAGRR